MQKLYPVLAAILITVAFQNCGPHALDAGLDREPSTLTLGDSSVSGVSSSVGGVAILKEAQLLEIPQVAFANQGVEKNSVHSPYALRVNLDTGAIELFDRADGNTLANRCLSSASMDEVLAILRSSQLCEQGRSDKLCAQRYTPEYASLVANGKVIPLGEEFDICGSGKKDLCGEATQALRGFVDFVKANWQDMSCQ